MSTSELKAMVDELFGTWSLMPEQTPEGLKRYGLEVSLMTELGALATRLEHVEGTRDLAQVSHLVTTARNNLASHDAVAGLTMAVETLRLLTESVPINPSNFVRIKRPGRAGTAAVAGS